MLVHEVISAHELAKKLGCGYLRVRRICTEYDIPMKQEKKRGKIHSCINGAQAFVVTNIITEENKIRDACKREKGSYDFYLIPVGIPRNGVQIYEIWDVRKKDPIFIKLGTVQEMTGRSIELGRTRNDKRSRGINK